MVHKQFDIPICIIDYAVAIDPIFIIIAVVLFLIIVISLIVLLLLVCLKRRRTQTKRTVNLQTKNNERKKYTGLAAGLKQKDSKQQSPEKKKQSNQQSVLEMKCSNGSNGSRRPAPILKRSSDGTLQQVTAGTGDGKQKRNEQNPQIIAEIKQRNTDRSLPVKETQRQDLVPVVEDDVHVYDLPYAGGVRNACTSPTEVTPNLAYNVSLQRPLENCDTNL